MRKKICCFGYLSATSQSCSVKSKTDKTSEKIGFHCDKKLLFFIPSQTGFNLGNSVPPKQISKSKEKRKA